jgi:hypothetical protein
MVSRCEPIPGTVEPVKGLPVKLYMMPASRFWQCSVWKDGHSIRRSTKSEKKADAIKFAKAFYDELLLKKVQNLPLTKSSNFETIATSLFMEDQGRVDRGERKQSVVDDNKYIFKSDLLKFFGSTHVKDINYQMILGYVQHLKTRGKRPVGSKTIKNHFITLSKILKHAEQLEYLDKQPRFPKIVLKDNPRDWFTEPQYLHLLKTIDQMISDGVKVRFIPVTDELKHLVMFLATSFLRPGDLKLLQHKHVAVVQKGKTSYLRIFAQTKVKPSYTITSKSVGVYSLIKGEPEDHVFWPNLKNRDYAMSTMSRQFREALKLAGLKIGVNGSKRDLNSLRHTCISNFILQTQSVDLHALSINARTSVPMIERHYASHLTAEMNVDKLINLPVSVIEEGSSLDQFLA